MCNQYSPSIIEELTHKIKTLNQELDNANIVIQQLQKILYDKDYKIIEK